MKTEILKIYDRVAFRDWRRHGQYFGTIFEINKDRVCYIKFDNGGSLWFSESALQKAPSERSSLFGVKKIVRLFRKKQLPVKDFPW